MIYLGAFAVGGVRRESVLQLMLASRRAILQTVATHISSRSQRTQLTINTELSQVRAISDSYKHLSADPMRLVVIPNPSSMLEPDPKHPNPIPNLYYTLALIIIMHGY